jgi:hypothetical protein
MTSETTKPVPNGVDPRGPRFGAAISSVLLLITVFLALDPATLPAAFWLLVVITALFAYGAAWGSAKHPYAFVFRKLIRPKLAAPKELEDPRPLRFAQLVGFLVSATGVVLYAVGFGEGLVFAAGAAFIAAFLNAAFALCLGCLMFVGLQRIGLIKKF